MKNLIKYFKKIWWRIKSVYAIYCYENPSKKLKIIGVTGTSGKTTTVTLLYKTALALGYKAGLISTVENSINGEVIGANDIGPGTTPDSVTLTRIFHKMVLASCEYVFMEVSSHSVVQDRVYGVNFYGGIFTNLSQDHLDYHKDMEDYFSAKHKFFKMLPENAFALSNGDDKYGHRILEGVRAKKYTFGFENKADFYEKLETNLIGNFNAYNALAVYASCVLLGWNKESVKNILKNIEPPRGRFEYFKTASGVTVIVDYAHKPDALDKVLKTVKDINLNNGKIISVFGCGGDRDPYKRPMMGQIGAVNSDIAIFTSDNPRSEDPEKIIEQMKTTLSPEELEKVRTIPDRREAIREAVSIAQSGDIILLAGKGHEDYQIIKGVKSHFSDMEEIKNAFK